MRSCVTVSLVEEARGGPFVFWHDLPAACRQAKELGFDAIEIFPPSPEALEKSDARHCLGDHGLALAAVGTGAGWVRQKLTLTAPDLGTRHKAIHFVRAMIDVAASLGAPAIIGSMQGRWSDAITRESALALLAEALEPLGSHARSLGVPLLFEPINRYETNLISTVAQGRELIDRLQSPSVKLLCDLFHMNIEEADIAAALREAGDRLGHVHFVDSNRQAAGFGHIDYAPIAEALNAIDFAGTLSAEALPLPDSLAAARQTLTAYRRWFGAAS